MHKLIILLFGFVLATGTFGPANGADPDGAASEEGEHKNHVSLFLGNTHNREDEKAFSIGLAYEYRVAPLFGIGALAEYAAGDIKSGVFGTPLTLHPYRGLSLVAMPGAEVTEDETNFLFRLGVGYEFELDRHWTIAPEFNADFVDSDIDLVFGFSLGSGF